MCVLYCKQGTVFLGEEEYTIAKVILVDCDESTCNYSGLLDSVHYYNAYFDIFRIPYFIRCCLGPQGIAGIVSRLEG